MSLPNPTNTSNPSDLSSRSKLFEMVYRHYYDRLYVYAQVICRSAEMAEDIVSELFHKMWRMNLNIHAVENLDTYLFVAVRNQSRCALKTTCKFSLSNCPENLATIDPISPEHILREKELQEMHDQLISSLPDYCQLIYHMATDKGLSYKEIASEMNISTETVKSQLSKAKKLLRAKILLHY